MAKRPALPKAIERQVKVEAGHRCAIPTCRAYPIEVAHIEPRKPDGSNDVFDNLIALCANCHTRYDRGKEIDRKSMRAYKNNLAVLNSRYGEAERRLLDLFAKQGAIRADFPRNMDFDFLYLLQDGLLEKAQGGAAMTYVSGETSTQVAGIFRYKLTPKGFDFVTHWQEGESVEEP